MTLDTEALVVVPGSPAGLARRDPADRVGLASRAGAEPVRAALLARLGELQNRLWAEGTRSVLLILQGMDTAGKDGTIRHVFTGVNPQGTSVAAFKVPEAGERAHDYLWRVHALCPARGRIGVFNRSHYEDVVTARVRELVSRQTWRRRFRHTREFERLLVDEGTAVLKVYLHLSNAEQRERLRARLEDPEKRWKFSLEDLDARARWDDYLAAYEETLSETSTRWAPWYVVPADHKWVRNVVVAHLLVETIGRLDPKLPEPSLDLSRVVVD